MRPSDFIDPFFGTGRPGNCLPGPYRPFGLVRLGPDTRFPQNSSGYESDRPVVRFSHTHVAGTGGCGRYGNIGVTPHCGPLQEIPGFPWFSIRRDSSKDFLTEDEVASPGFYSVRFPHSGITAELTATARCGVHRYFYESAPAGICLDIGSVIRTGVDEPGSIVDTSPWDAEAESTGGCFQREGARSISGRGDFRGGWGHQLPYSVFFFIELDIPWNSLLAVGRSGRIDSCFGEGRDLRLYLDLGDRCAVELRVGISYVSVAQAREAVELTRNKSFGEIRDSARCEWDETLADYCIVNREGTEWDEEERTMFYSSLYHLYCMPTDLGIDDEDPRCSRGVRSFTDFYCLWDSVRNASGWLMLTEPTLSRDICRFFLSVYETSGWLFDAWIAHQYAYVQGGGSASLILAEALRKGLDIDADLVMRAIEDHVNRESEDPMRIGRYNRAYREKGYLSVDDARCCVSRTIEYAAEERLLARLLDEIGDDDKSSCADEYHRLADRLWDLWNPELQVFAPRDQLGMFVEFDPVSVLPDSWNDPYFYEASAHHWIFMAFHDLDILVERLGGPGAVIGRIDEFFATGGYRSKEMLMHIPLLYSILGRPDRMGEVVRNDVLTRFSNGVGGLEDNEDMGVQSTCYIAYSAGLYPLYSTELYFLCTPRFADLTIPAGEGNRLRILRRGPRNGSILSVVLNGEIIEEPWIEHHRLTRGGRLEITARYGSSDWCRDAWERWRNRDSVGYSDRQNRKTDSRANEEEI